MYYYFILPGVTRSQTYHINHDSVLYKMIIIIEKYYLLSQRTYHQVVAFVSLTRVCSAHTVDAFFIMPDTLNIVFVTKIRTT